MNKENAISFIMNNARPLELALYKFYFENDDKEKVISELKQFQNSDGGFDISWKWYTEYEEFATARDWWRPRITLDKLLFEDYA